MFFTIKLLKALLFPQEAKSSQQQFPSPHTCMIDSVLDMPQKTSLLSNQAQLMYRSENLSVEQQSSMIANFDAAATTMALIALRT